MNIILKKIFVFIISWSLLNMQLGVVMANEEAKNTEGSSISMDDGSLVKDAVGNASRIAKVEDSEGEEDMTGTGTMTMLTMIAIGYVTWRILDICMETATTDIYVAAAAGAAFIIGEMVAIFGYTDERKKELEVHVGNEDEEQQTEALKKQRQTYQDIKDTAETKLMLQRAAGVGFGIAAGLATWDWYQLTNAMESCDKSLTALKESASDFDNSPLITTSSTCKTVDKNITKLKKEYEQTDHEAPSKITFDSIITSSEQLVPDINSCGTDLKNSLALAEAQPQASAGKIGMYTGLETKVTTSNTACRELATIIKEDSVFCSPEKLTEQDLAKQSSAVMAPKKSVKEDEIKPNEKTRDSKKNVDETQEENIRVRNDINKHNIEHDFALKHDNESPIKFVESLISQAKIDVKKEKSKESFDYDPEKMAHRFLEKIANLVAPAAHAFNIGMMNGIGLAGAAAGIVAGLSTDFVMEIDKYLATPGWRAIIWGALGAATLAASSETQDVIDKADANLNQLDQVIDRMERLKTGVAYANDGKKSLVNAKVTPIDGNIKSAKSIKNKNKKITDNKFPCTATLTNGQCASLEDGITKSEGFNGLPNQLQAAGSNLGGAIDSATNKPLVEGTTLDLAKDVAGAKNAVDNYLRKNIRKLNNARTKAGKKPINFKGKGREFLNVLRGKAAKRGQVGGASSNGSFSKSSGGKGGGLGIDKANAKKSGANSSLNYTGGKSGLNKGAGSRFRGKGLAGVSGLKKSDLATDAEKLAALKKLKNNGDIVDNESAFIFDIISSRYIKSGYPRLLDDLDK